MRCPYCEHEESKVLDSRPVEDGAAIRRRRECLHCGRRFTGEKVLAGLVKAAGKRPVSIDALEALVLEVEREIRNRGEREIPSLEIGEMVMERLRHLDDVAYVRFASEHRRFEDVDTLVEEIETLKARKAREAAGRAQVPLIPLPTGTPEQA